MSGIRLFDVNSSPCVVGNMWAQAWDGLESLARPAPDQPGIDVTDEMQAQVSLQPTAMVNWVNERCRHGPDLKQRACGCVVKVSARGSEGRRFDTRVHQLSD